MIVDIEKNIKNIEEIYNSIKNYKNHINKKIRFIPEDNEGMKEFLESIKKFWKLGQNIYFEIPIVIFFIIH